MTAGEHEHCFCTEDTGGRIICCRCGKPLEGLYDEPELVLMWEQLGHEKNRLQKDDHVEKRQDRLPGL